MRLANTIIIEVDGKEIGRIKSGKLKMKNSDVIKWRKRKKSLICA